tara:strand:+ start:272 stop:814 length:543 start_codon:yes stop_codon:yes gene_type:complete
LELIFKEKKMKKLWSVILLIGLVNAQMPQPTLVGQDELQIPTLSINNFVNQAEIEGLEDTRVFLGITNILNENVMDSRYDLVEQDSDFEMTARVVYLGRPRTSTTILGLFRRETTTTEVRVVVELKNKKTGKVVSGNGVGTIDKEISATGFQINEELPFDRSELGGALKEAIGNAVQEIL